MPRALTRSEDTIRVELTAELPQWSISAFGVAKNEPNLFFGYDTSAEEMRWRCVEAVRGGRLQDYVSGGAAARDSPSGLISSRADADADADT